MKQLLLIMLLGIWGCNGAGKGAFQGLDNSGSEGSEPTPVVTPVHIDSFTPNQTQTILTQTSQMVFGVSASGSGTISYEFDLDGVSLQSGQSPFYVMNGGSVAAGDFTLKVTASNNVSSDSKEFTIRKNSPAQIVTFSPALTGSTLNCGLSDLTFSGVMSDLNNDPFTISWELDSVPVTSTTPFTNVTTTSPFSQLRYNPDCTQSGSHTVTLKVYDGFEVTSKTWTFSVNNPPAPPGTVAIQTFTPTLDPVILTSTSSATFAVTVNDGSGAVNYEFIQDNSATLQNSATNFYALSGSTLTSGYHSLKVRATNSVSSAEKIFNIRKNTAPAILSFSPALLGANANCASGSITFDVTVNDNDSDTLTKTWELDNTVVTGATAFTTVTGSTTSSQLVYAPDCTKAGSHSLKLTVSDGYESVSKTWTFSINNPPAPPGNVHIVTFTPSVEPVVMTDGTSTTFAVSIQDGAGSVTYEFKKDYSAVLQNSETPFYVLNGSSLSPGVHTLKVKGTNSVSYDEKVFTVRKNTPTSIVSYSPSLNGSIINCGQDSLTFNAVMTDVDNDIFTRTWELDSAPVTGSTQFTTVTSGPVSSQLVYTPDCSRSGVHTVALKVYDGYETTTLNWSFNVNNPAVESLTSYFPTSNALTYLSTDASKTFNVSGSGVGALTFKWKLDGTLVKTDANVTSSSYPLLATDMTTGDHTLEVFLTDSTTTNDPASPVKRTWSIYKNMKPRFVSYSPTAPKLSNLNNPVGITATLEDALDTFTVTLVKGSTTCTPNGSSASAACGLSGMTLPTATGTFTSIFSPGSTFLGENNFQLRVTDSHGESISQDFTITANYFSNACNNLGSGQICTLVGLPGLGSGLSNATDANRIRISPAWMIQDDQSNWIFSDHSTNVVWYYNTKATAVTIFGLTIPAYSIQVIAGTGIAGTGGNGVNARSFALSFGNWGGGLAWDTRDSALYIADYSNNRVVKVNSTGRANIVCGLGSSTSQGALATTQECINPVDLEIDNTNRRLYVSLQARHIIKYIDITNTDLNTWPAYTIAGLNNTSGNVTGTTNLTAFPSTTIAGTSRLNQPWGLHLDTTDQILYFTEYGSCKVRAMGLPGSTMRSVAGQSITSGNSFYITNGSSCASEAINGDVAVASTRFNKPMDVLLEKSGSTINGFYVTDVNGHRMNFCNNSGSAVTIGNQTIGSQMCNNVLGNGSSNSSTIPVSGKNTSMNNPLGMFKVGGTVYVGDRGYNLIRSIVVNASNGALSSVIGGVGRASYSGNSPLDSKLVTFNNPVNIIHRESNKNLYVSDSSNAIIRSINLNDGRVEDFAGGISGNESRLNTTATSTNMSAPRGMAMYGDIFLYADQNNNCFVRAYNPHAVAESVFGTLVNSNRTTPVAGYYNNCGAFVGTSALSVTDPNAKLQNPYSMGVDAAAHVMYVSSRDAHCIMKVSDDGTMIPFIGTCGTVAPSPVYGDTYNSTNMKLRFPGEIFMDPLNPGNFFFTDFTDQNTAHVKYVNITRSSVVINGTTVSLNNVETVYAGVSSPGYIRSVTAFENMVCFTSGTTTTGQGNNTVNCYNRDDADTTNLTRFGVPGAGAIQQKEEQEGISAVSATFAAPMGLAFDASGNLYVTEQGSHVIRLIKKWW